MTTAAGSDGAIARRLGMASLRQGLRAPSPLPVLVGVIVVIAVATWLRAPEFVSHDNLIEILRATSTYLIVACPLALLMIAGGLDFSVGATFSVGAVLACQLMVDGASWPLAVMAGLAAGAGVGVVSGALVSFLQVPPIIATLSVFFVATGLINVSVKGLIAPLPDGFLDLAQGTVLGLPLLVWYATFVSLVFWTLLEKTRFGYELRAVGGNRSAAQASGIRVRRIDLSLYVLCGGVAALAGILYAARTSAGQPEAGGFGLTLQVTTAVLVGGISLSGGVGSISGVVLGSLLFGVMQNALGVAGFDQVWSDVFVGVVLAVAVTLDGLQRRARYAAEPRTASSGAASVSRLELERLVQSRGEEEAKRVMEAISAERRRIERDIHDGAQQQLVNAALMLQMASEQLRDTSNPHVMRLLSTTVNTLREATSELRDLGRGIYPVLLSDYGLVPAVESLISRSTMPIELVADNVPRADEKVEITAYFVVAEAVTNVLKHARARSATITIAHDGEHLHVTVSDDGIGDVDESAGSGLQGLRQRVQAAAGEMTVSSPAGEGTTLAARLPVR